MAQRKKATASVDEAALVAEVRATLARDGSLKLMAIKPAALRATVVATLQHEGFEATKAYVRRPLFDQLREALGHGALVPVKSLGSHVRGASATELKAFAEDSVRKGVARRVLRGTAEVLAGPEVRVLSGSDLETLRVRLAGLAKTLEKVTKKRGMSVLASDAASALSEALAAVGERKGTPAAVTPRKPIDGETRALLEAVDSARDARTGLSFVPAVIGRLAPQVETNAAIQLLMKAAERELLELRPEGGIGRLSEAELSVCPVGPHGTRLSWARRLSGGAT